MCSERAQSLYLAPTSEITVVQSPEDLLRWVSITFTVAFDSTWGTY